MLNYFNIKINKLTKLKYINFKVFFYYVINYYVLYFYIYKYIYIYIYIKILILNDLLLVVEMVQKY
jgi:hypothetical protein